MNKELGNYRRWWCKWWRNRIGAFEGPSPAKNIAVHFRSKRRSKWLNTNKIIRCKTRVSIEFFCLSQSLRFDRNFCTMHSPKLWLIPWEAKLTIWSVSRWGKWCFEWWIYRIMRCFILQNYRNKRAFHSKTIEKIISLPFEGGWKK